MKTTKIWEDLKEQLGYPNLKMPEILDDKIGGAETASINMRTKEIVISKKFMDDLKLPFDISYKAISGHEANHYVTCPYDLKTLLLLTYEASKSGEKNADALTNYFEDVVINIDLVKRDINEIAEVYKAMDSTHIIDETLRALYYLRTGLDFGIKKKKHVDKEALKQINKLDYENLDTNSLRKNAKEFARIMNPLLEHDRKQDMGHSKKYAVIDNHGFENYSGQDIYNVANSLADELEPGEYKEVMNKLPKRLKLASDITSYYEKLSRNFPVTILSKKIQSGNILLHYSDSEWDVGDDVHEIDIYKSKGKIFPGITRKKTYLKKPRFTGSIESDSTPDALIILDSSGSMSDPEISRSYAVLGGFCIANQYLKRNKRIAVSNFSDHTKNLDFSTDKKKIYSSLLQYEGLGTILDLQKVQNLIDSTEECDIYLITDMAISNQDSVYSFFDNQLRTNRTNIFLISGYDINYKGPINVHSIQDESDLPNVIIKDLKEVAT